MASTTFYLLICVSLLLAAGKPDYCQPGDKKCWPSYAEIRVLYDELDGNLITPTEATRYSEYVNMTRDTLYLAYPSFVVVSHSASDIQTAVIFAASHNIQISICSTGHSYSGRNTANNSLQINLSEMKNWSIPKDNNSITVETGLQWGSIYEIVDGVNRIVVGGSDPGVGPGGWSLGGGHSVIGPHYGLGSDFVTDYWMVDAKGDLVHIHDTQGRNRTEDDLFWSLRGTL